MKTFTVSTEPVSTRSEMRPAASEIELRAVTALRALLSRISAIKLLELKCKSEPECESNLKRESRPGVRSAVIPTRPVAQIFAKIDVFGHNHTLACAVIPDGEPSQLRTLLRILPRVLSRVLPRELETGVAPLAADAVFFVIAPYLSPEAQALLKQSSIGFLDFEGNARLNVGEIFIGMRSMSRNSGLDHIDQTDQSALLHAFPARSTPVPIAPEALPVPSALPAISRNRVGAVAIPA